MVVRSVPRILFYDLAPPILITQLGCSKCGAMKDFNAAVAFIPCQEEVPPRYRSLTEFLLVILVGLTGVGKSTVIASLREKLNFTLLPNRREITNEVIIRALQEEDDYPPTQVTDRVKRFEYTARYRARHPGGMAHALSRLFVDSTHAGSLLLFDGLRGLNEVQHAAISFPQAYFIVLDASDTVRLARLLKRADIFDTTSLTASSGGQTMLTALTAIQGIAAVFSREQLHQISQAANAAALPVDEVVKRATVIVEERRNYDPITTRAYLTSNLSPEQVLIIDTATQPPEAVTAQATEWLNYQMRK